MVDWPIAATRLQAAAATLRLDAEASLLAETPTPMVVLSMVLLVR
jgi:hypothetical protein